ncbi:hypothetical protein XENORESO_005581 [Xenotaenia resolanae]|uniref:Uncharacterized protein n=1 Tax=Xenotaenia resolanae TaxID=208358 RepID=A0ABV0VZA9_9TELE
MDMLNENTLSPNSSDIRGSELTCEEDEACKIKKQDDPLNIQLQLLQLFETVSLSQDFSMLQELVESLSSALGGDTQEDQLCMLESIKEESSEGEDEELAREASGICEVAESAHQPSTRGFNSLDAYKAEEVKTELFSIQDYLECVGRLQDHADVLEDVKKDLLMQASTLNNMEELQIQLEGCQDTGNLLSKETKLKLEDVTFDIQCFISEHAQFLSPAQSSYLLKFLTSAQRAYREQTEKLATQRSALDALLDAKQKEKQEEVCLRN